MPTTSYVNLEKQFGTNNYKPLDVVFCRGEGVWVWDIDWALDKIAEVFH